MSDFNLTQWVNDFTEDMYSWAVFKVSDTELAKDLVQDTFLVAAEKISTFKGKSSPKTWLFSILNFKIIDYYRANRKMPFAHDGDEILSMFFNDNGEWQKNKAPQEWQVDDSNLLDDEEFAEILKMCLELLPEKWNMCVNLKYIMGKSGKQICEQMDISKNNYWQMIHRAKLSLRDCIESKWYKN